MYTKETTVAASLAQAQQEVSERHNNNFRCLWIDELLKMDKILGVLAGDGLAASRNDDDFTDRLQYRFTTMLLIMFAVVVTTNSYVGKFIFFPLTFQRYVKVISYSMET